MRITPGLIIETIHTIALAIWIGGLAAVMVSLGAGAPHLFIVRECALIEIAGFVIIGVQYLSRRRYHKIRTLFIADGIRHLFTFGALLIAEFVKYSLITKDCVKAPSLVMGLDGLQIAMLSLISLLTLWLYVAGANVSSQQAHAAAQPASPPERAQPKQPARSKRR